jgi:hypothetical protein
MLHLTWDMLLVIGMKVSMLLLLRMVILVAVVWRCVVDHVILPIHVRILDFRVVILDRKLFARE